LPNGLTLGPDGNFYGITYDGGSTNSSFPTGMGTVFKVSGDGALSSLVSFAGTNGANPVAGLTLGPDGNFYGVTQSGGDGGTNDGTVFEVTTNGILTSLVSFDGTNGASPAGGLALGPDGNFYGTATGGGSAGSGTVFSVTTTGQLTLLSSFAGTNGSVPAATLTLGPDGNFYGTTEYGGLTNASATNGFGTIFRLMNGVVGTLAYFSSTNSAGRNPATALTLGNDDNFYGLTGDGGTDGLGGAYKLTTNGTLTSVAYFNSASGGEPLAALALGPDGNFYGVVSLGGTYGTNGAVFRMTTNGLLTQLASFTYSNGAVPVTALALGNDGRFYGTTALGGASGYGTVFRLLLPPLIGVQPQSQTNHAGATVIFTVGATSLLPVSYQWLKNGTNLTDAGNISGSASNALTVASISDSDAAGYSVIVNNADLSVTSSVATLTVIDPPLITNQPAGLLLLQGTNAIFNAGLTGTAPLHYQWQFNGTNIANATGSGYEIFSVATNNGGNYSLVVSNAAGVAVSSNASLTVVTSPKSQTNYASSTVSFSATAFGPEALSYQWQENGTNLVNGDNFSGATNSTLVIDEVSDADAGGYSAIVTGAIAAVVTSNATLVVNNTLVIAQQPLSQTIGVGSNVTFTAVAYGLPPFIFQWYYSNSPVGSPITGTNVTSYTLTAVQTNQSGSYHVQVLNGAGSLTSSNAVLTVKVFAPNLGVQPSSQRVPLGDRASFIVSANGTPPLAYQWKFNGTNLPGATNLSYVIAAVAATNTGNYSVVITNAAGSASSTNALLTVLIPPALTLKILAGYPVLYLNGMLSNNFLVQYNTNLGDTNWVTLLSLSNLLSNPYAFLDPAGSGEPARFYRAVLH
jgi:uncharacterized repeat protein (TIGR03803 family)